MSVSSVIDIFQVIFFFVFLRRYVNCLFFFWVIALFLSLERIEEVKFKREEKSIRNQITLFAIQ